MTLNAAFIKGFNEELTKRGFVKVKGRHTYYAKLLNNEIIQFITYMKEKTYTIVENSIPLYAFDIVGGVESVYRSSIELGRTPDNQDLGPIGIMTDNFDIFMTQSMDNVTDENRMLRAFRYNTEQDDITLDSFNKALAVSKKYLFPTIEKVTDVNGCIDFFSTYNSTLLILYSEPDNYFIENNGANESLLYFLTDDYSTMINNIWKAKIDREKMKMNMDLRGSIKPENFDKYCEDNEKYFKGLIEQLNRIYEDKSLYKKVLIELNRRKQVNIERAADYGLL